MNLKRFLQNYAKLSGNSSSGFTIFELLVALLIGFSVLGFTLAATLSSRTMYKIDVVRTRINQDLRGTMDIIGNDVRIAGENFSSSFPAILLTDGGGTLPDTLSLRRNLQDEILKVCVAITSGATTGLVYFASGTASGCLYSDNTHNYNSWRDYRVENGGTVSAYIYDTSTRLGEWFKHNGESGTGGQYSITRTAGAWSNSYNTSASAVYRMEEWKFQLVGDTLQLIQDNDTANPLNVAFGIKNFQAQILLPDGTTRDSFTTSDNWATMQSVRISITGTETFRGDEVERTLTSEFFPRNILSN